MKYALWCLGLGLALPTFAFAQKVIFIGGSASQKAVLDRCYPGFENMAYPPSRSASSVAAEIDATPGPVILAAHSTGSRFAFSVASLVRNKSKVRLIDIDGYRPPVTGVHTTCWRAVGGASGRLVSRNYGAMSGGGCNEVRTYHDAHCQSTWCMHFSLVNPRDPATLADPPARPNWIQDGYSGCGGAPWLQ